MNTPLYIFDLDGTLALIDHRRHLVQGAKPDWPAFFRACVNDKPNAPVLETLSHLHRAGCDVQIWSARSDEVRKETVDWLRPYVGLSFDMHSNLKMRAAGDYTSDEELKAQWLHELSGPDRLRLVAIFDDRDKVVAMWRHKGVACFQVAPGAF